MPEKWEQSFVGREDELDCLKKAYERAAQGSPQIVKLLAESGIGKTRLAQELFKWLSMSKDAQEPRGYWPDRLEVIPSPRVNPIWRRGLHLKSSETIPFLWWGLRWEDPTSVRQTGFESALTHYAEVVEPHLMRARLEREGQALDREAMKESAGVFLDLGTIGLWGAGTTILSLGRTAYDRRNIRTKAEARPEVHYETSISERSNALFEHLQMFMDQKDKSVPTVPVVILLDDAHWATGDRDTLGFIERLVSAAVHQNWPLMVLATHWLHPWHEQATQDTTFRHLCDQLSPEVEQVEIELGLIPVDYAIQVVRRALPGVLEEHRSKLVRNCGGNMLLLVQMIKLIAESTRNFEGYDTNAALSGVGRDALERVEHADLYQVVYARFRQLGRLGEILGCAAQQGARFIVPLLQDTLSPEIDPKSLEDGLAQAERPLELIDADISGQDSLAFAEPIHHHVAADYLKQDYELHTRMQERLAEVLVDWVETERCFGLARGDRALFFNLANDLLGGGRFGGEEVASFSRNYLAIKSLHGGLMFGLEQLDAAELEIVDAQIARTKKLLEESFLTLTVGFTVPVLQNAARYLPKTHQEMFQLLRVRSQSIQHAAWILGSRLEQTSSFLRYIQTRDADLYEKTLNVLKDEQYRDAFTQLVQATGLEQTSNFLRHIEERDPEIYVRTLNVLKDEQYRHAFTQRVQATGLEHTSSFLRCIEDRDADLHEKTLNVWKDEQYRDAFTQRVLATSLEHTSNFLRYIEERDADLHEKTLNVLRDEQNRDAFTQRVLATSLEQTSNFLRHIEDRDPEIYVRTLNVLKDEQYRDAFTQRVQATGLEHTSSFLRYIDERDADLHEKTLNVLKDEQYRDAFTQQVLATSLEHTVAFLRYIEERDTDFHKGVLRLLNSEQLREQITAKVESSGFAQLTAFFRNCRPIARTILAALPAAGWLQGWTLRLEGNATHTLGILEELHQLDRDDLAAGLADHLVEEVDAGYWDYSKVHLQHAVRVLAVTSHRADAASMHFATTILTREWVDERYASSGTGWLQIAGAISVLRRSQGVEYAQRLVSPRLHEILANAASRLRTTNTETLGGALQLIGACSLIGVRPERVGSPREDVLADAFAQIMEFASEFAFGYIQAQFAVGVREVAYRTRSPVRIPNDVGAAMLEAWGAVEPESDPEATLKAEMTDWLRLQLSAG